MVKALEELGHEVCVVSPPGIDVRNEEEDKPQLPQKRWKLVWHWISRQCPQFLFELLEIGYNIVAYGNLRSALRTTQADLIYERYAFWGFAGVYCSRRCGVPLILEVNEISGLKRTRGQVLKRLTGWIEKKIFERADAIVVVSEYLKNEIGQRGIAKHKIAVIPNGVNSTRFSPAPHSGRIRAALGLGHRCVLGFVGSFVRWHHFDFLFDTFGEIAARTKRSLCLMLVGDGPEKIRLKQYADYIGLSRSVVFTGAVSPARIPEYIQAMDICLIPHSNEFRSPIKMFEYMAMGKTVVAPRVEPVTVVITDNVNGILFEPGNRDDFSNRLCTLIDQAELRRRIGSEARKTIVSRYLWTHNAGRVIEIYRTLRKKRVAPLQDVPAQGVVNA
jgi:glycosyltransferase involved in cell wall biosynthesis